MNEKIRELALQAGIGFTLWDDSGREMIDNYTPEERLAEFAELIVKECIQVCADRGTHHDGLYAAWAVDCSERIGKHFGVDH